MMTRVKQTLIIFFILNQSLSFASSSEGKSSSNKEKHRKRKAHRIESVDGRVSYFIQKLRKILDDPNCINLKWGTEISNSFVVLKPRSKRTRAEIQMTSIGGQIKTDSFARQLSFYGFSKIKKAHPEESWCYCHDTIPFNQKSREDDHKILRMNHKEIAYHSEQKRLRGQADNLEERADTLESKVKELENSLSTVKSNLENEKEQRKQFEEESQLTIQFFSEKLRLETERRKRLEEKLENFMRSIQMR